MTRRCLGPHDGVVHEVIAPEHRDVGEVLAAPRLHEELAAVLKAPPFQELFGTGWGLKKSVLRGFSLYFLRFSLCFFPVFDLLRRVSKSSFEAPRCGRCSDAPLGTAAGSCAAPRHILYDSSFTSLSNTKIANFNNNNHSQKEISTASTNMVHKAGLCKATLRFCSSSREAMLKLTELVPQQFFVRPWLSTSSTCLNPWLDVQTQMSCS